MRKVLHSVLYPAVLGLCLVCMPVHAEPYVYAPATCDFTITFPEKPYIEKKCSGEATCAEVVTFTKVLDIGSSVHFRVTCLPMPATELARYTPDIMETTLNEMLKQANLEPYSMDSEEKDGVKRAGSVSFGKRNDQDVLHTGQLWVGKTSLFTIEGEMLGTSSDKLNQLFADILKTIQLKSSVSAAKKTEKEGADSKKTFPSAAQP